MKAAGETDAQFFPNPQLIKIILNMTNCIDGFFFIQMYYLKWNRNNDTFVELANMPNWNRCRGRKNKNGTNRTKGQSTIKNIGCSDFTGRCRSKDPFPLQKDYSWTWHVQISRYQGSIAAYTSYIICM